jgi:hypothetical protein
MALAAPAMVTLRPECLKVKDAQPDKSAKLLLQIHKLKQGLSGKNQEIETLKEAITELKQAPRTRDKKAFVGDLEITAISLVAPNTYEIKIGGKQTLILNAENPDKVLLYIRDYENQEFLMEDKTNIQMNWITPEPVENGTAQQRPNVEPPPVEQWDWLQYVVEDDVREELTQGLVVVMMHRFDCPVCEVMGPRYSEYYQQMVDQGANEFKIAFLAIPPYGEEDHVPKDTICIVGKLTDNQKWELMSPYVVALLDGELVKTWEQGTAPEPENILTEIFGE